jgi:protein-S-isoprenylcysteine O-methyltransferase Ste14
MPHLARTRRKDMETIAAGWFARLTASDFEFRHRMSLIAGIFALAFSCSWMGARNAGETLAGWLIWLGVPAAGAASRHVAFGLASALVAAGAGLRTWGTAHLHVDTMEDALLRSERLVVAGPYRHVRNPLYLGNLLVAAGMGFLASRTGIVVLVTGMGLFSCRLILREEQHLLRRHGAAFRPFLAVPRLWPAWRARVAESSAAQPRWAPAFRGELLMWAGAAAMALYAVTFSVVAFSIALSAGALAAGLRFRAGR